MKPASEPIFNLPPVIMALIAVCVLVHALRALLLSPQEDIDFLLTFAFIPARYESGVLPPGTTFPGGFGGDVWTFVTYAFVHGDLMHLLVNTVWLLPFGSAVARRFGAVRFLAFFAATATAGAIAHLVSHPGELLPMIGSSAAISGFMAGSIRFVFEVGGPLGMFRRTDTHSYMVPAAPLMVALRDPRILAFLIVWFGLNFLFGLGSINMIGADQSVAWQAHIGGFLAGLVLFAVFDPVAVQRGPDSPES